MMVNFYLKDTKKIKTAIIAQVYIHGKRHRIATGISIPKEFWNTSKQRCRVNSKFIEGEKINIKLKDIEETIETNATKYQLSGEHPTQKDLLRKQDNGITLVRFGEEFVLKCGFAENTVKKYVTALNKIKLYEVSRSTVLTFQDINIDFYRDFKEWFYGHINPKTELPFSKNYFGSIIKVIKSLVSRAREDGLTDGEGTKHSHFTTDKEDSSSVYLSVEELTSIYNLKFTRETIEPFYPDIRESDLKRKIKSYETVRGRFLLGAFTGLRVSDYLNFNVRTLQDGYLRIKTKKADQDIIVPLHPSILALIESGKLDSKVSHQKLNDHIKEICKVADISELVTTYRKHGDKTITATAPKYSLITTHTARRSFATNAYKAGVPTISIMKITGHKTESSFMKYIRISQQENADIMKSHPFFSGG